MHKKLLNEDQIDQVLNLLGQSIPMGNARTQYWVTLAMNRSYFIADMEEEEFHMSPATLRQQLLMVFDECQFGLVPTLSALRTETLQSCDEEPNHITLMSYYVGKMVREAFA